MKNKSKIFIILSLFTIGLFITLVNVNAEENVSALALNKKQTEVANKIQKEAKEQDYPSYYGGVYISEDSSHVILQVVEDNIPKVRTSNEYSKFNALSKMSNNIEVEYVKNSYKELNDLNNQLIEYYSSPNADITNLVAHYVDTFENVVVVKLKDVNLNEINKVKKSAFDSTNYSKTIQKEDLIIFSQAKPNSDYSLKAGEEISTSKGKCSMGYRVKVNGKKGYITAGHCFSGTGDSSTGGTVKWRKYSGNVDAAFVQSGALNVFTDPLNDLMYTDGDIKKLNASVSAMPAVNSTVAKAGFTTKYTTGQIKNLNYSANYNGTYFTGLVATNMKADHGDSGGPVFIPQNIEGGATLLGIIKGDSDYNGAAYVNADNIFSALNYVRY